MALDAATVAARLGLDPGQDGALGALEAVGPGPVPPPGRALAILTRLGAAPQDAADAAAALPDPLREPEWHWLLGRATGLLLARMGDVDARVSWPALPAGLGARGRLFLAHACLGAEEEARRHHAAHGVPPPVSAETLATLGWALGMHRRLHGAPGLFEAGWHTRAFRGCLYQLGRLQYTPERLDADWAAAMGGAAAEGEPVVGVHVPETGPLEPGAVTESLRRARALFGAREPWGPCRLAVCGSWLLDPQLRAWLPPTSNILRFQERFRLLPGGHDADRSVLQFVFHRGPEADVGGLPQGTTLERALVAHWRAGGHWLSRRGWLEL